MKTETKNLILKLLQEQGPSGPSAIATALQISLQMVHRHLKSLLMSGDIRRQGAPPKVLYFPNEKASAYQFPILSSVEHEYIDQNYLTVKPDGEVMAGLEGFQWWALKTQQHKNFKALALEYITTNKKFNDQYRNDLGVIDATFKIKDTFDDCYLDYLFYQEFYSLPKFGKTKTGQMVFLGKSGQNIKFIHMLADMSRQSILNIIEFYKIDGVIFAPHSIPRKISFLVMLKLFLSLNIPCSTMQKVFVNDIPIAQKSLSKLSDRIENASNTIFTIKENSAFKRVLVIDDAVGSGATLNIIASKLKEISGAEFVCGFAITGSLKGFEVINEI
jgi:hypothetical protein